MTKATDYPLLDRIDAPSDLRKLDVNQLPALSHELRNFVVESVSRTGGHLGSSLGTIELTIAIHYVYNTPRDKLVWDVGHQTYGHKILTGRRHQMPSMRKQGGLAGFPNRAESEYDTFGVGHSSTSISAALGMALAARQRTRNSSASDQPPATKAAGQALADPAQGPEKVVAVIGDGALTAGLAYEALNHAGGIKADMLVILNDNDMSISPNVGAMNKYLARMLSGKFVSGAREGSKRVLSHVPSMLELARRTEEHVKGMVVPSSLFEELGFNYFGPVDGHDVESLVAVLRNVRELKGPVFLHVVTRKGQGYKFAEQDPLALHAIGPFDTATGKVLKSSKSNRPTYTQVFGQWLCDMAGKDDRLIGITPAMREGSGMVAFEQQFPDRYFDVGIAEQHAVTLAAGLACGGMRPVVAIYSTFFQRSYDQLIHDVVIQNLPVVFAIDRAGLVGPDGPTHSGSFDFSFMRCLPNIVVMAPADENECRQMLYTAMQIDGPSSVRYPRGNGPGVDVDELMTALPVGKAQLRREGKRVALLAFGTLVEPAQQLAEELDFTMVNMRFVKPLDTELLESIAQSHDLIITLEENSIAGGAGAGVLEYLSQVGATTAIKLIGLPDEFVEHGSREELLEYCRLDLAGLREQINVLVAAQAA
ncbi:1-deoxy-D-xylulose-5-phosphate synthase [Granulosicoccus antarcticus]|uniref:1-deoxy-D-xylulose-5-phosphate synthase n=1 Tax=Granulosicoccus antarcticus IMCC3135 TaxID=1192854 RepID=A0A2Z2NXK8_9GAMM|nr:1-deoxy-D-xylulose-5-phosphate synthase [Granulosicoccus antarcticus]ASJ76069.1 1-deoxy-D-xylulose-5-phosphate synthase [Granulosicoccus antarcticus IMCC3135]